MLKVVETSTLYALRSVKNNTFRGEVISFDLKANGVGYSSRNPDLSRSIVTKLEELKTRITNGEIAIVSTYGAAKQIPGFPQNLNARDD
jgi:basic membrane protein A